ncbi:hypothetical protein HDR60_02720 [bacterium]|nr:hypothetical protein [bacterium]
MNKVNSSIEINLNPTISNVDYWDYDKVDSELNKFEAQRRDFYLKNGYFYYNYFVSTKPTTFVEKDLHESSKEMETLTDKFNKIEDENVVDMFKGFFDLFQRSPSVYTLLSDLIDIYNADLKALKYSYASKVSMESNEKMKLLRRSFDIFSHLLNRDKILETIIKTKREKLSDILLNEDIFFYTLKDHSELLEVSKKQLVMDSISQQLKDNQR